MKGVVLLNQMKDFLVFCLVSETFYTFPLTGFPPPRTPGMSHFQRLSRLQLPGNFPSPGQPQFLLSVERIHSVRIQRDFEAL